MNKIWIVEGSRGEWDDWTWFIVGIYDNKQVANDELNRIVNELTDLQNKYSKDETLRLDLELSKYFKSEEYLKTETLTNELNEFYDWKYGADPMNYNIENFTINEYDINKRIYNFS
jgi:hypothetical protein